MALWKLTLQPMALGSTTQEDLIHRGFVLSSHAPIPLVSCGWKRQSYPFSQLLRSTVCSSLEPLRKRNQSPRGAAKVPRAWPCWLMVLRSIFSHQCAVQETGAGSNKEFGAATTHSQSESLSDGKTWAEPCFAFRGGWLAAYYPTHFLSCCPTEK